MLQVPSACKATSSAQNRHIFKSTTNRQTFETNAIVTTPSIKAHSTILDFLSIHQKFNFRTTQEFQQCEVIALPKKYVRSSWCFGFQKHSPLLKIFNYYLAAMAEEGSLNRIINSYAPAPQMCPDNTGKPLGYESLIFVFLVMIFGIGLVFAILIVEWIISKLKIY